MDDPTPIIAIISLFAAIQMVVYGFGTYSYRIAGDKLDMQRRILGYVPFGRHVLQLVNISEVRRFHFRKDFAAGGYVFGNILTRRGHVIVLKRRWMLVKRVYITPTAPEAFAALVNRSVRAA